MATILFVEDDELQGKVTKDYLESEGFEVIWVDNGRSAIKIVKTQPVELRRPECGAQFQLINSPP